MDKFDSQVARMQALMNYGRSNESVKHHVEYSTMGADGKSYGIVRENNKYFIKVAEPHEGEMLAEDYDYIGGYMNHRAYEYDSYKNALKQLELKLMSLNEAKNCKTPIQESYRPNAIEEKKVEMTEGMQAEIARQRQIMANACRIMKESVNIGANNTGLPEAPETAPSSQTELNKPFSEVGKATLDKDMKKTASDPKKQGEPFDKKGEATNADLESDKNKKGGDSNKTAPFKEDPKHAPENNVATQKPKGGKAVKMNESETLAINSNPDYMDKSKGTEVGDDAPFTEPAKGGCNCGKCEKCTGKVEEGVAAWKEGDNQNSPTPGTGEVGDDAPFDQKVNEGCDECGTVENCNEGEYCADCDALLDEVADDADEYAGFEDDDDLTFSDDEAQSFEDEYGVNPLDLEVDDEPVVDNGVGVDEAASQPVKPGCAPISGRYEDHTLSTGGEPLSEVYDVPKYDGNYFYYNDKLANGIMLFRDGGDSLRFVSKIEADSTEKDRFIELDEPLRSMRGDVYYIPCAASMLDSGRMGVSYSLPHLM